MAAQIKSSFFTGNLEFGFSLSSSNRQARDNPMMVVTFPQDAVGYETNVLGHMTHLKGRGIDGGDVAMYMAQTRHEIEVENNFYIDGLEKREYMYFLFPSTKRVQLLYDLAMAYVDHLQLDMNGNIGLQPLAPTPPETNAVLKVTDDTDFISYESVVGKQIVGFYDKSMPVPAVLPFTSYALRDTFAQFRETEQQFNQADVASHVPPRGFLFFGNSRIPFQNVGFVAGVAQLDADGLQGGLLPTFTFDHVEIEYDNPPQTTRILFRGGPPQSMFKTRLAFEIGRDEIQVYDRSSLTYIGIEMKTIKFAIRRVSGTERYEMAVEVDSYGEGRRQFTGKFQVTKEVFQTIYGNF